MAHIEDHSIGSGEKIKPPPQFSEVNSGQQVSRLIHPKKRKFDVTEFEENTQSQSSSKNGDTLSLSCSFQNRTTERSDAVVSVSSGSIPSMLITDTQHMTNGLQSENILISSHKKHIKVQNQPKITPYNTSSEQSGSQIICQPLCMRSTNSTASLKAGTYGVTKLSASPQVLNEEDLIDLREWCNHRVLAKQKDHYVSGVIRSCDEKDKIHVEFDPPNGGTFVYHNIFNTGQFDIVSDASPSISDVSY